ncbi:11738_t:CDS:2 [Racocetra persica]|uniref:11738_t:CDS:1 n=1 Tax=Racocetra persica TaxID=160502 RepID=A0ACA9PLV0_9GLOM|nr:11738_t:CDS:2 [Racocetra persica]
MGSPTAWNVSDISEHLEVDELKENMMHEQIEKSIDDFLITRIKFLNSSENEKNYMDFENLGESMPRSSKNEKAEIY